MRDSYYSAPVGDFLETPENSILGELVRAHHHALEHEQRGAWIKQIQLLKQQLHGRASGHLFFEFSIPRMGKRADVVVLAEGVVFVIEFKVGSTSFDRSAIDQAHDYALDLKNFHLGSHDLPIVPVLVATGADAGSTEPRWAADQVAAPLCVGVTLAWRQHWPSSGHLASPSAP